MGCGQFITHTTAQLCGFCEKMPMGQLARGGAKQNLTLLGHGAAISRMTHIQAGDSP